MQQNQLVEAIRNLIYFHPEHPPNLKSIAPPDMYLGGEETEPFFSEAFLYCLLGKEDARTLRARIKSVMKLAGIDPVRERF